MSFILYNILGTCVGKTIYSPVDVLRIRLQCQQEMLKSGVLTDRYVNPYQCFQTIAKNEGFLAFWKGNLTNIIKSLSGLPLQFFFMDYFRKDPINEDKTEYKSEYPLNSLFGRLIRGGAPGAISAAILYPLDYARTRLINDIVRDDGKKQFDGIYNVFNKTYQTDGIRGLYRGLYASLFGVFFYRAVFFGVYDTLKNNGPQTIFSNLIFANIPTMLLTAFAVYPIDTARRRMIMTSCEVFKYEGVVNCIKTIINEEGVKSLYAGFGIHAIGSIISLFVLLIYYDIMKTMKTNIN